MLLKLIFTMETTVLTFEMKSWSCWSLQGFCHWFQQYVEFILCTGLLCT